MQSREIWAAKHMATLREFYDTDFSRVLNAGKVLHFDRSTDTVEVPARVHLDFDANAKYLSCYLSSTASTASVCKALLNGVGEILAISNGVEVRTGFLGEEHMGSGELQFAGRLFIYHEGEFDQSVRDELGEVARTLGVFVQFRGPRFAAERTKLEKPFAFICHDSRDKEEIARPVAIGLSKLMCPVWFDEFSLRIGARLRESVERGLKEARKCVLVITPHFLGNAGWTKAEFNAIFTRELVESADVILPIWQGVAREQVYEYSPVLADRFAVQWSLGVDEVVRRLYRAIIS